MTFHQRPSYDDEELSPGGVSPARPAEKARRPVPAPLDDTLEGEEAYTAADEPPAAQPAGSVVDATDGAPEDEEGVPPPAPVRVRPAAAPRRSTPPKTAAKPPAPKAAPPKSAARPAARTPSTARPASPAPRPPAPRSARAAARTGPVPSGGGVPRWLLIALVAIVLLGATGAIAVMGNNPGGAPAATPVSSAPPQNSGDVAATVNGKPISKAAWQERVRLAKQDYIDQFQLNFDNDQGKRMEDVLAFDVLDQMINFEILMQEAQRQGIVTNPTQVEDQYQKIRGNIFKQEAEKIAPSPNPTQVEQRLQQINADPNEQARIWSDFLKSQNMTSDAQFRQTIIDSFIYLIMATNHTTPGATDDEKTTQFANYICSTREKYDVKILVTFIVPQTPCESAGAAAPGALPSLSKVPGSPVPTQAVPPAPVETGEPAGLTPGAQP
jgi:SurA-like protein